MPDPYTYLPALTAAAFLFYLGWRFVRARFFGSSGFRMSGEMASVFAFKPETIFAGLKLRG